jgi:hypothetical protein
MVVADQMLECLGIGHDLCVGIADVFGIAALVCVVDRDLKFVICCFVHWNSPPQTLLQATR